MVRKCCACFKGCSAGEKITLHKFPKDELVRRQWIMAIERKNFVPSNTSVICSRHFTPECFTYGKSGQQKRVFIKPNAVPSVFPPLSQSRRSLMRSSLPPLANTENSDNGFLMSQSSNPEEFVKRKTLSFDNTNASEAAMSIQSIDYTADMDYLKDQGSSIDWVEYFDQSNDSAPATKEQSNSMDWGERYHQISRNIVRRKRDSSPESCTGEQKNYDNNEDIYHFKSRRRILKNLNLALSCIAAQRKELKIVKQKNRLLEKRLSILKALLTHVLSEKLLSDDDNESTSESESEIWSG